MLSCTLKSPPAILAMSFTFFAASLALSLEQSTEIASSRRSGNGVMSLSSAAVSLIAATSPAVHTIADFSSVLNLAMSEANAAAASDTSTAGLEAAGAESDTSMAG